MKKASKVKRIKKLEAALDKAWSEYVRGRDKVCCICGSSSALSAHHAFGRRHMATRWDVVNGCTLCYPHHIHYAHRDICSFAEWFHNFVGDAQYKRLAEAHNQIVKHTEADLERMLADLRGQFLPV